MCWNGKYPGGMRCGAPYTDKNGDGDHYDDDFEEDVDDLAVIKNCGVFTFIIQLLILSLLLRSTSLCVARLVLAGHHYQHHENEDHYDDEVEEDKSHDDELTVADLLSGSVKNV